MSVKMNLYNALRVLKMIYEAKKYDLKVSESDARLLFSYLMNESVSSSSFKYLIENLERTGYISRDIQNQLLITDSGIALLNVLGDKIQSEAEIVENLIKNMASDKSFVQRIKKELTESKIESSQDYAQLSDDMLKKMQSNAFFIKLNIPRAEINLYKLYAEAFEDLSDTRKYMFARALEKKFTSLKIFSIVEYNKTDNVISVYTFKEDDSYVLDIANQVCNNVITVNVSLSCKEKTKVIVDKILGRKIIEKSLQYILTSKGLTYCKNNEYFNFNNTDYEQIQTENGIFRKFVGFKVSVEKVEKENDNTHLEYIAWIDPSYRLFLTVGEYISHLRNNGYDDKTIKEELLEFKIIRTVPFGYTILLDEKSLDFSKKDLSKEYVKNSNKTFLEYWKETYNITLENLQELINCKTYKGEAYKYPSHMIYFDRFELERKFGRLSFGTLSLDPQTRYFKTKNIIEMYFCADDIFEDVSLNIEKEPMTWYSLYKKDYLKAAYVLFPPNLIFNRQVQKDKKTTNPKAVFLFGPYSGHKEIHIHTILYPTTLDKTVLNNFLEDLSTSFKQFHFGTLLWKDAYYLTISKSHLIKAQFADIHEYILNIVKNTPISDTTKNSIALIILPKELAKLRLPFKENFASERNIPVQIIIEDTINAYFKKMKMGILKNLSIQIYTKVLKKKEAVWILDKPADKQSESLYVGLGFSQRKFRDIEEISKANSFAALCDAKGENITWTAIKIPFVGPYIRPEWFKEVLKFILNNATYEHTRIVLYRQGVTYDKEITTIKDSFYQSKSFKEKKINWISLISSRKRVYSIKNGNISNPPFGLVFVLSSKKALIFNSFLDETNQSGTAQPLLFDVSIGDNNILDYTREYFQLCYLNWESPFTLSKHPIVMKIAKNIASIISEDPNIDDKVFEWLPL